MTRVSRLSVALIALMALTGASNASPFGAHASSQRVLVRNSSSNASFLSSHPPMKTVLHAPCTGPIGPKHMPCR
jgi:hypothetical protein